MGGVFGVFGCLAKGVLGSFGRGLGWGCLGAFFRGEVSVANHWVVNMEFSLPSSHCSRFPSFSVSFSCKERSNFQDTENFKTRFSVGLPDQRSVRSVLSL